MGELALKLRSIYWTALEEPERAAAEPSEESMEAWLCVAHECVKQSGEIVREIRKGMR